MTSRLGTVLLAGGAALAAALTLGTAADAQERVQWKMQSAFPSHLPHTGVAAKRVETMVARLSDGNFELRFYEPGALVPALECFDAASKGSVEACYSPAAFHTGKIPALAFFTTVPFGPQYGEFFAWKIYGGGDQLEKEIYDRHGLTKFDCGATGPETSGWFREKVGSLADLKGLKMRFLGLGAQVMQKLGVSTQLLAPPDIYPALERGVIDATEFAMPDMDIELGFYQIAKYNYYPGWHQPVSVGELLMNKAAFEALPATYQAMLEAACGWNVHVTYAESEAMNPPAMNKMLETYGVQNVRWTDVELAAFEQAWDEVLAEQAAADPTFKKVADSYLAFRKVYTGWGDAQALEATYLSK
jgi:TRAP-type mannitol/chloroaromatic compound transport system substrate-binding protein